MDDTSLGSPPPAATPAPAQPRPVSKRTRHRGLVAVGAAVAVAGLLGVAACAGSSNDGSSAGTAPAGAKDEVRGDTAQFAPAAPRAGAIPSGIPNASHGGFSSGQTGIANVSAVDFGRSQIKTAQLGLRSKTITTVMTQIENVATGENGFVANENTVTDVHGRATSSSITIRVPVDSFEAAIGDVAKLGQVSSRRISTQDVTGRVADVASRVTSAKDSIAQLRVLFSHATKLSDIITLESELSDREADLESLLAQQRALTNATTLSTISVQVSRPPTQVTTVVVHQDKSTGFIGGLKQGWNALADTFVAVSHGLGAALPLGLSILVIAALVWAGVRRLPRRHAEASE